MQPVHMQEVNVGSIMLPHAAQLCGGCAKKTKQPTKQPTNQTKKNQQKKPHQNNRQIKLGSLYVINGKRSTFELPFAGELSPTASMVGQVMLDAVNACCCVVLSDCPG